MSVQKKCRIVIADDHLLVRRGLIHVLQQEADLEIIGEASDGEELLALLEHELADLLIVDLSMPKVGGIEVIKRVRKKNAPLRIVVLTMYTSRDYLLESLAAGADAYLLKDNSEKNLLSAIQSVRAGKRYICPAIADESEYEELFSINPKDQQDYSPFAELTAREKEVLQMVVMGKTSRDMAASLGISSRTIDHHRASLLRKFKMKNSIDMVNYAVRKGLFSE